MGKLSDMFNQARRAQASGGIGFVGKNKPMTKPRAAALVVEIPTIEAGSAESAIKSGADGLLFTWNGKDASSLETLKMAIDAAQTNGENVLCGLHITGGWEKLERENFEHLKELGVNYIVLPLHAPARLLALQIKDLSFRQYRCGTPGLFACRRRQLNVHRGCIALPCCPRSSALPRPPERTGQLKRSRRLYPDNARYTGCDSDG